MSRKALVLDTNVLISAVLSPNGTAITDLIQAFDREKQWWNKGGASNAKINS